MANKGYFSYKNKYNKEYGYEKEQSHNLKQISKDTGVSMKGLQQIYNKGIGAYKTNPSSVRPSVKSKEQWAMARVYSSVMGGKASKIDANELKMAKGGGVEGDEIILNEYKPIRFTRNEPIWFQHSDRIGTEALLLDKTKGGKAKIKILKDYTPYTKLVETSEYLNKKSYRQSGVKEMVREGTIKIVSAEKIGKVKTYMPINHNPYSKEFKDFLSEKMAKGGGVGNFKVVAFKEDLDYKYYVVDEIENNYLTVAEDKFDKWKNADKFDRAEYYSELIPKSEMVEIDKMENGGGVGEGKFYVIMDDGTKEWYDVKRVEDVPNVYFAIGNVGNAPQSKQGEVLVHRENALKPLYKKNGSRVKPMPEYADKEVSELKKYANGGGVGNFPAKGELVNKENYLVKYEKIGNQYEFYVYQPITKNVSAYEQKKYVCVNKNCPLKMSYNQFINYLYAETYLDDLDYAEGGRVGKIENFSLARFEDFDEEDERENEENEKGAILLEAIEYGRKTLDQNLLPKLLGNTELSNIIFIYLSKYKEFNLYKLGWRIQFGLSKQWVGLCSVKEYEKMGVGKESKNRNIYLSSQFHKYDKNWKTNIKETVHHEMAHAVVRELFYFSDDTFGVWSRFSEIDPLNEQTEGHGKIWEMICNTILEGGGCSRYAEGLDLEVQFKDWKYECFNCGTKKFGNRSNFATKCITCGKSVLIQKNKY